MISSSGSLESAGSRLRRFFIMPGQAYFTQRDPAYSFRSGHSVTTTQAPSSEHGGYDIGDGKSDRLLTGPSSSSLRKTITRFW